MGYKIVNSKVGFPSNVLVKVINKLEDNNINYLIKYKDNKEDKDIFKICKNNISKVRKNKINYLIIDNLVVIESHFYKDNNYNKYKMLIIVEN